jgi:hypothetical protein
MLNRLGHSAGDKLQVQMIIQDYQALCYQCWGMIKELQTEFEVSTLQEFVELVFNPDVLEYYHAKITAQDTDLVLREVITNFHKKMSLEIFDQGNKYWLILRTAFNHMMTVLALKPHLLKQFGFDHYVAGFALCREVRSLDSEILLYKLQHIVPQIFPKGYEDMNLEEITYQGAYIRTMTMLVIDELIRGQKRLINSGGPVP